MLVFLQDKFPEVERLRQEGYTLVTLTAIFKLPFLGSTQFVLPSAIFKVTTSPHQHNVFSASWCLASLAEENGLCISI